jgi:hypothetical protein
MYALRYMPDTERSIRLKIRRTINEKIVVFSVPGIGSLSLRTYPMIAKKNIVSDTAKANTAEVRLKILVDL